MDAGKPASWTSVDEALRNPVILHHIFNNLGNELLLSSCSLVNKTWSKEACTLIQNYRQCQALQPPGQFLCPFLEDFDRVLGQIAEHGGKIPYNGMKIQIAGKRQKCSFKSVEEQFNLQNNFNLQYLDVKTDRDGQDCLEHHSFATLIRHKGSQLKNLKLTGSVTLLRQICGLSQFIPQLELLDISDVVIRRHDEQVRQAMEQLLSSTQSLKKIVARSLTQLKLIPKEKLPSLLELRGQLKFRMAENEDLDLLNIISVHGSSKVKKLSIYVPPFEGQSEENDDPLDDIVDPELRRSFDCASERMLQTSSKSIEELSIYGVLPLGQLCVPPLVNVSKFIVKKRYAGEMEQLWASIGTVDYERIMPALKAVEITVPTTFVTAHGGPLAIPDLDRRDFWPPEDGNIPLSRSTTVREVTLQIQVDNINLGPLKAVFPNVSIMHFQVPETTYTMCDFAPLAEIWKYFPHLEELKFTEAGGSIYRNYDADFCGITEEEAELLRQQTAEDLEDIQIVPIRPSVLHMAKLRKLEFKFREDDMWELGSGPEDHGYLVSKVTRFIAFNRMPNMELDLPIFMESFGSDAEEDFEFESDEPDDFQDDSSEHEDFQDGMDGEPEAEDDEEDEDEDPGNEGFDD